MRYRLLSITTHALVVTGGAIAAFALIASGLYIGDMRATAREARITSLKLELTVANALLEGYAEHDRRDDQAIADLKREHAALREDFEALEAMLP